MAAEKTTCRASIPFSCRQSSCRFCPPSPRRILQWSLPPLEPSKMSLVRNWSFVVCSTFVICHSTLAAEVASPLSPADAQKAMVQAAASLRIELAAAEPDVVDPVAIRFDEDGRMWVVEMRDYPLGNPAGGEP